MSQNETHTATTGDIAGVISGLTSVVSSLKERVDSLQSQSKNDIIDHIITLASSTSMKDEIKLDNLKAMDVTSLKILEKTLQSFQVPEKKLDSGLARLNGNRSIPPMSKTSGRELTDGLISLVGLAFGLPIDLTDSEKDEVKIEHMSQGIYY
jgi:hypothetical protein